MSKNKLDSPSAGQLHDAVELLDVYDIPGISIEQAALLMNAIKQRQLEHDERDGEAHQQGFEAGRGFDISPEDRANLLCDNAADHGPGFEHETDLSILMKGIYALCEYDSQKENAQWLHWIDGFFTGLKDEWEQTGSEAPATGLKVVVQ